MKNSQILTTINDLMESQRAQVINILDQLTNDACNWNPQNNRNSIANLVEHITAAEAFHYQEVIMGQKINRNRDKEFEYRYRSKKELRTAYNYVSHSTKDILTNKLSSTDLNEIRKVRGEDRTILWILEFILEHNFYHIGQINFIAGLLRGEEFLERPRQRFESEA